MGGRRLLVTIDDAGMAKPVDEAVIRCAQEGVVDCVSVMATGPSLDSACAALQSIDVLISAHLNCVRPPFLTDARFPRSPLAWLARSRGLAERVRDEWRMQIEALLARGLMLTRLDSHRHIHHLPGLRKVAVEIAREYGISGMRAAIIPDRALRPSGWILNRMALSLEESARRAGLLPSACMLGYSCSGNVSREYLTKMERHIVPDRTELVMHPATRPVWSDGQPLELELMLSEWFGAWTRPTAR